MFESVSVACVRAPVCMLLSEAEFFLLLFIVPHIEQWNAPCRKRTFIVPTDRRKNPYALRSTARLSRYRWRWPVQCNTTTFPIPSSCPSVAVLRPDAFELGTTAVRLPPPPPCTPSSPCGNFFGKSGHLLRSPYRQITSPFFVSILLARPYEQERAG